MLGTHCFEGGGNMNIKKERKYFLKSLLPSPPSKSDQGCDQSDQRVGSDQSDQIGLSDQINQSCQSI